MKRVFDLTMSLIVLFLFSPIMIIIAWKVKSNIGSPVVFTQIRPGINGEPFKMFKFCSMKSTVDHNGNLLPDSERMTTFGGKLRNSSLDELPGLWNVVKGEMSLVGPRPLLMQYLPLYNKRQATRHSVLPGITGWAQVNGRNAITWDEKFEYDAWYVENQSFTLDLKILLLTVKKVFISEGISADGHVTIEPFKGNKNE